MTITDAALSIIVLGMLVLALAVDLAALFGFCRRNRTHKSHKARGSQ